MTETRRYIMSQVKAFKEKIIQDEAFGQKFSNVQTPEELVSLARGEGFDFTVEDVKNNTDLTDAELGVIAGGASVFAKNYFVGGSSVFAKNYFVKKG
jgi:predicted ribosomally synthesized peptide with nif11-like leader